MSERRRRNIDGRSAAAAAAITWLIDELVHGKNGVFSSFFFGLLVEVHIFTGFF